MSALSRREQAAGTGDVRQVCGWTRGQYATGSSRSP